MTVLPISSPVRTRFRVALRRLNRELAVGEPLKSRLIVEMAADLEEMASHFERRGMSPADAEREAEARLLASPHALDDLVRVHTTAFERFANRTLSGARSGLDLILFLVGLSPLVAVAAIAVSREIDIPGDPGAMVTLLLGLFSLLTALRIHRNLRDPAASLRAIRTRLEDVLFLAVFTLGVGASVLTIRLTMIFHHLSQGRADVMSEADSLIAATTVFTLALLIALACGQSWFVLTRRLAGREMAESRALLAD